MEQEGQPNPWERTLSQMFELFFNPELERRSAAGALGDNFILYGAQVIFPQEGAPYVLFNDEMKGQGIMRAQRHVAEGEPILVSDLAFLERFDLPNELLDNGHFTIFRVGEAWRGFFNFLTGRNKAADMLRLSSQYLEAAMTSAARGHNGPAVDNLFSACELASKAELIIARSDAAKAKSHKSIRSEINKWMKLGNIDRAFVALFNKLANQRHGARYGDEAHRPPIPSQDEFTLAKAVIERGLERVIPSTERNIPQSA